MQIREFIRLLDTAVPLGSAGYEKDALGMQVALPAKTELTKVLCVYEVTEEVIDEAHRKGANLIVAFHPLIFPTIGALSDATRTGALLRRLIKLDIALYVLHTAFDTHPKFGTSRLMAEKLGLENIQPLSRLANKLQKITALLPTELVSRAVMSAAAAGARNIWREKEESYISEGASTAHTRVEVTCETWNTDGVLRGLLGVSEDFDIPYEIQQLGSLSEFYGMGAIGLLPEQTTHDELVRAIHRTFGDHPIRLSCVKHRTYRSVAMVGGSGMEFYSAARKAGAEVFITADVRYHDFYRAEHDGLLLVDAGHSETERFVARAMAELLRETLATSNPGDETVGEFVLTSDKEPNAVRYA